MNKYKHFNNWKTVFVQILNWKHQYYQRNFALHNLRQYGRNLIWKKQKFVSAYQTPSIVQNISKIWKYILYEFIAYFKISKKSEVLKFIIKQDNEGEHVCWITLYIIL